MSKVKLILSVLVAFLFLGNINAQSGRVGDWCGTEQV